MAWSRGDPDWMAFAGTLFFIAIVLGGVLGYRCQGLGLVRPLALSYPVSWRLGCVWVVLAAMAEFFLTDLTVSFTLDVLSPHILISTMAMAVSFCAGCLTKRVVDGIKSLSRQDLLQIAVVLLAAAMLAYTIYITPPSTEVREKTSTSAQSQD